MTNEPPKIININKELEDIGDAVLTALAYKSYPLDKLKKIIKTVEQIIEDPGYLKQCENHFKSAGSNYVLFFLSNIIYNLKKPGELVLTPDVLKWLGSVWINFLKRNKSYQELFPLFNEYKIIFKKYYPGGGSFVNQFENVNLVKNDFIDEIDVDAENSPLKKLEKVYQITAEVLTWMKPTYFFLLDYYYEKKLHTGQDLNDGIILEAEGLKNFGHQNYSYSDIILLACQALGILEAIYLILKKKKSSRRIINIDNKQKFLTTAEIYTYYLDKFNATKKEIKNLINN